MTTIAYHHESKTIACDGRMTSGNRIVTDDCNKMTKCERGWLWFASGSAAQVERLIEYYQEGAETGDNNTAWAFVVKDKEVYMAYIEDETYSMLKVDYSDAIGSGREFAVGAMDHGAKNAKEAVKYACTRDSVSGGKIRQYKV